MIEHTYCDRSGHEKYIRPHNYDSIIYEFVMNQLNLRNQTLCVWVREREHESVFVYECVLF